MIYNGEARNGANTEMKFIDPIRTEKKHKWGGCLMGVVFRGSIKDCPVLTLYSRTTYLGYMGMLDAAIAYLLAKEISNGKPETIAFRWYINSMQFHFFKSLPYMFTCDELYQQLNEYTEDINGIVTTKPTWLGCAKWYSRVLLHYKNEGINMVETEKYGPFKRIKRTYC